ncbi:MAG TPA: ABC transporter ATP-binding protein [Longimicrobium sp.]|nr:ABC transporter ATP-binding protein [Longimicrobium sp.]
MSLPTLPTHLPDAELAVETRGVAKRYGRTTALRGLDLQVPTGAVYVLAGPNGAGKSTALKVLLDAVRPDAGSARVCGIETARQRALARAHVGYVPEGTAVAYPWLRVEAFLHLHGSFYTNWDAAYAVALCRRLGVPPRERMRALSKGTARRVSIVAALAHRPPVLLLDEPTDGLDPLAREELNALLVDHMAASPTTVLWCTHHVHETDRLADYLGVLLDGRLLVQAPRERVRSGLRRYRAQVPEGWTGAPGLNGGVLEREQRGGEIAWTVWGDEREVAGRLATAGAEVRDATTLTMEEAVVVLLRTGSEA